MIEVFLHEHNFRVMPTTPQELLRSNLEARKARAALSLKSKEKGLPVFLDQGDFKVEVQVAHASFGPWKIHSSGQAAKTPEVEIYRTQELGLNRSLLRT